MAGIPVPNLSRFREKHITGSRLVSLIIYRKLALPFCDKRDIIVSQRVDRTLKEELLYIFQFDNIYQKFTSILILVESISGNQIFHFNYKNNIPYQIIQRLSGFEKHRGKNRLFNKEYLQI